LIKECRVPGATSRCLATASSEPLNACGQDACHAAGRGSLLEQKRVEQSAKLLWQYHPQGGASWASGLYQRSWSPRFVLGTEQHAAIQTANVYPKPVAPACWWRSVDGSSLATSMLSERLGSWNCPSEHWLGDNGEDVDVIECVKRTYQPSIIVRKRRHGFLARVRKGNRVLQRRRQKGRRNISA